MMNHHDNYNGFNNGPTPAERLAGMELCNGWRVENIAFPPEMSTGGTFSVPYMVYSETRGKAFLKAMDYSSSFANDSVMDKLLDTIQRYRHELNLLQSCAGMSRVVRLLDWGETRISTPNPYDVVYYLIFELAECDIRVHVNHQENNKIFHQLQLMHQITVALQQLHNKQIAHLDIKPSNVLVFDTQGAKLADLGRSIKNGQSSPFDSFACAGDKQYAPPELLYPNAPFEWKTHRLGCDFYLLGSLMFFLITERSMTELLFKRLQISNESYHFDNPAVSYDDAFPYVLKEFLQIIRELRNDPQLTPSADIVDTVKQLCDPNPAKRGLPMNKGANRYSLEKFVSKFNLLYQRNKFSRLPVTPTTRESLI